MKLLSVVLLLLPLSAFLAEVVNDFRSCKWKNSTFFPPVNGNVSFPTMFNGPRFKNICQTLNNQPEFATFYDTENKIPVYSSYRFYRRVTCIRKTGNWFIEPQLEDLQLDRHMASEAEVRREMKKLSIVPNVVKQALNGDYVHSGYDKGHLAPVYQASTQSCSDATFTLTNAAPQQPSFNSGKWKKTEKDMAEFLSANCINKRLNVYVVTGVVPGNTPLNNSTVRIPSHFWTAYCCLDYRNKPTLSGGYIGENSAANLQPIWKTVLDLETDLTREYKKHFPNQIPNNAFTLFAGQCR